MFQTTIIVATLCSLQTAWANPYLNAPYVLREAYTNCKLEANISLPRFAPRRAFMDANGTTSTSLLAHPAFDLQHTCLHKCIVERVGILNAEGEFAGALLPPALRPLGERCNEASKAYDYGCERAHNFTTCLVTALAENITATALDCANRTDTLDAFDAVRAYAPREFLKEKRYACLNRCMLVAFGKFELPPLNTTGDAVASVDVVRFYAPPDADVTTLIATCSRRRAGGGSSAPPANRKAALRACRQVVKTEICLEKKLEKTKGRKFKMSTPPSKETAPNKEDLTEDIK